MDVAILCQLSGIGKVGLRCDIIATLKELQGKKRTPVDEKYNGDDSFDHPFIAMRSSAEEKEIAESFAREAVMKRMADAAKGQFP